METIDKKAPYSAPVMTTVVLSPLKPLAVSEPLENLQEGDEWDWS